MRSWGPLEVHILVANFVRLRFPTLLAVNKCDTLAAGLDVARVRAAHPCSTVVGMAAGVELALLEGRARGLVAYAPGDAEATLAAESDAWREVGEATRRQLAASAQSLARLGGSGTLAALDAAMGLKPPLRIWVLAGNGAPALSQCRAMAFHPGSSVADVYTAMKNAGLAGEFVRASLPESGDSPVRKDAPLLGLGDGAVLRILTNRRVAWQ